MTPLDSWRRCHGLPRLMRFNGPGEDSFHMFRYSFGRDSSQGDTFVSGARRSRRRSNLWLV